MITCHKDQQCRRRLLRSLVALVLAVGSSAVNADEAPWGIEQQDPMWYFLMPRLRYIKTDIEYENTTFNSKNGGGSSNYQRVYVGPAFGIGWDYFLYHPDLLTFSLLAEPGYDWEQLSGTAYNNNRNALLLNGKFTGFLLREKPYSSTITYSRTHDQVNYDFYNSATVDAENINLVTGYREGPVPVFLSVQKSSSDSVGYNQEVINDRLTMDLHARNERKKEDVTDFAYQFSELSYDNHYQSTSTTSDSTYHHFSLNDVEHFSKSSLNSGIVLYDVTSANSESRNLNSFVSYNFEHTPHLRSFYSYVLSAFEGTGTESVENFVTVGVAHQLYESLNSGVNLHGSALDSSSSSSSSLDSYTFGVGESEDYAKRLGSWGRLSLGNSLSYDTTDQQVAGSQQFISGESHTIPTTGPMIIRLNQPNDVAISSITKNNIQLDPSEWMAIKTSNPWQIQFFNTPINNLQPGDVIVISYTVLSNPSGAYSVFNDGCRASLRFWDERAEIYIAYNLTANYADSSQFLLQDFNTFEAGADCSWRGFYGRASYIDQHSTFYDFQSLTFSEGYSTPISKRSTVGVSFSQQWNFYPAGSGTSTTQSQTGEFYSFMAHYDWHPASAFTWNVEAGYQRQSGLGYDQNLFTARTYLNWTIGKLELHLGYEHDNHDYVSETRDRDFIFLRLQRNF